MWTIDNPLGRHITILRDEFTCSPPPADIQPLGLNPHLYRSPRWSFRVRDGVCEDSWEECRGRTTERRREDDSEVIHRCIMPRGVLLIETIRCNDTAFRMSADVCFGFGGEYLGDCYTYIEDSTGRLGLIHLETCFWSLLVVTVPN